MFVRASKFLRWLKCHPQTKQHPVMSPRRCRRSWLGFGWAAQTAALPASSKAVGFFLILFYLGSYHRWVFPPGPVQRSLPARPGQQRLQRHGSCDWSPDGTGPSHRQAHKLGWNPRKMAIAEQLWALSGYGEAKAAVRGVCQSFKRVNVLK